LVSIFLLFGIALLFWVARNPVAFGPTPTPTRTPGAMPTQTLDFRATRILEDMLTQVAYLSGEATRNAAIQSGIPLPDASSSPPASLPPDASATVSNSVLLPSIQSGISPLPTPIDAGPIDAGPVDVGIDTASVSGEPTASVVMPLVQGEQPSSPLLPPEVGVTPIETPTAIAPALTTETPTLPPSATPPSTATLPPTPAYSVNSLNAVVNSGGVQLRAGPGNSYAQTGTIAEQQSVQLIGRDATGEWVKVCCVNNIPYWARSNYLRIKDNILQPGAPAGANANDVRWLSFQIASMPQPAPTPTATPITEAFYPQALHDRSNTNLIARAPAAIATLFAPPGARAGGGYTSPVLVSDTAIYVASSDGNIYSFDKFQYNQRWRHYVGESVSVAMALQEQILYAATQNGLVYAIQDQGSGAEPLRLWQTSITMTPYGGIKLVGNKLLLLGRQFSGGVLINSTLFQLDRYSGAKLRSFPVDANPLFMPTLGNLLIYIGGGSSDGLLWALDIDDFVPPWSLPRDDIKDLAKITASPLYVSPGTRALAELYIWDNNGRLWALDANNGNVLWKSEPPTPMDGVTLSLANNAVIVAGNGALRAINRSDGRQLWSPIQVDGAIPGGAISDGTRAIFVTSNGLIISFDVASGVQVPYTQGRAPASAAPALSGQTLYIPSADGSLFVAQGQ
jgi:outer membrane protein assembly factor BamB